jgi:hypothetical protein
MPSRPRESERAGLRTTAEATEPAPSYRDGSAKSHVDMSPETRTGKSVSDIVTNLLTMVTVSVTNANPAHEGRLREGTPKGGAGAVPGAQPYTAFPGGSGHRPVRRVTGLRGARCTGAGEGPPVCTRWFQEARPGAEKPRWSAERRACPLLNPPPKRGRKEKRARAAGPTRFARTEQTGLRCGFPVDAPAGAPPPFLGGVGRAFLQWLGKARVRRRIARTE